MHSTDDLFADQGPEFAPQSDRLEIVAGKIVAVANKPSPEQKRFNKLMAQIDMAQKTLQTLQHAMDTHGTAHRQAVAALGAESGELLRRMVLFLDQRLQAPDQPKGLTPKQKQQITRMVLMLADVVLEMRDDAQIEAIVQRYDPEDEEDALDEAELAQAMLDSYLGEDFAQGRTFNSPEEVLRAAMEHEQRKQAAAQEKRDAKRAARKAAKAPSAREQAAAQKEQDALTTLRTVYRQLASSLHPDREPDAQRRAHKTALMSEVNAAYERKDLSLLLRIQLQEEMVDASKAASLSQERLKAMCSLLAEQLRALEQDQMQLRMAMDHELSYPYYHPYNETLLLRLLREEREGLEEDVALMRYDLERVQDDKGLKAWLKEQLRESKQRQRSQELLDLDAMVMSMMGRR